MNKLCNLLKLKSEDELFVKITQSFKEKITRWDYFVNWEKVIINVKMFEKELNILNYLIGKDNLEKEAFDLFDTEGNGYVDSKVDIINKGIKSGDEITRI
jgi:type II restriction enzyme